MMLWCVLLFAAHLAIRLLERYLFYVPDMVLCGKMVSVIYKKEKSNYNNSSHCDVAYLHL